jgi:type I restriction enzyme S subunit
MSFPRYPKYKDSGVEWLGEVPEHWRVYAFKHRMRMRYGDALATELRQDGDIEVFGSNGAVGTHCVANTKSPAIVVGRKGSYGKVVWAARGGFVIDTAYAIDADTTSQNLRWVFYALHPMGLDSLSQDTGVPGLAREKAYEVQLAVPPPAEQTQIAAFLDRETAKIDALVAEQRRLMELLKEKRQAVISHAVTRGLNPHAPMKPSGIEWLGDVPEHWEVKRLKHNLRLLTEKTDRRDHPVALENIEGWTGRFISTETEFQGEGIAFEAGDILFGKLRPYLAKAYRAESSGEAVGDFHVMRPVAGINSRFAQYQILNREFIAIVDGSTFGSKMPRASWEFVGGMKVTTPPLAEQTQIAAFLDAELAKFDTLTAEAQRAIDLLQERRTALISAAVTGQIDVRQHAPAQKVGAGGTAIRSGNPARLEASP